MLFAVVTYGPCLYGHASTCIWQTDAHSDLSDIFSGFLHPAPKGVWWAYGWSDPLSQSRKCALFSVHSHQDRYRPGPAPFMTDIGTSQARRLAADDVLFMQQITGDTGSGLQGYAPDAFLHFPGISRVRRSQRRERGAEDFSLTRGISAAELTHIDHERKRMTRYFKPLQKWRRTKVFPISSVTVSLIPFYQLIFNLFD